MGKLLKIFYNKRNNQLFVHLSRKKLRLKKSMIPKKILIEKYRMVNDDGN